MTSFGDAPSARLSMRLALVLSMSCVCTGVAAVLTWLSGRHIAEAVLAGLVVFASAFRFFDSLIAHPHQGRTPPEGHKPE